MSGYKVWCLSWDDTEDEATTVSKYDPRVKTRTESRQLVETQYLGSPSDAALVYADWLHGNRDGWEATWPLTFRVKSQDGTEQDFEVAPGHGA